MMRMRLGAVGFTVAAALLGLGCTGGSGDSSSSSSSSSSGGGTSSSSSSSGASSSSAAGSGGSSRLSSGVNSSSRAGSSSAVASSGMGSSGASSGGGSGSGTSNVASSSVMASSVGGSSGTSGGSSAAGSSSASGATSQATSNASSVGASSAAGSSSSAGASSLMGVCTPGQMLDCYTGPVPTRDVGICHGGQAQCLGDGSGYGPCLGEVTPQAENCLTPEAEDCNLAPDCGGVVGLARYGDAAAQDFVTVATAPNGTVMTLSTAAGSVDFGGGALVSNGGTDVFLAQLDPTGGLQLSGNIGDAAAQEAAAVHVDSSGNVLLAGSFAGTIDLGGGPLTSAGGTDVFVGRLAMDGAPLWSRRIGDAAAQRAVAVAQDTFGNVVLAGTFAGTVDLGGGPLTSAGGTDVFVTCMSSDGVHIWSRRFGGPAADTVTAMVLDGNNNVFLTGSMGGSVDFGGGPLTSAGGLDAYLVKLSGPGSHLWSRRFGDPATQEGTALAVDAAGNVALGMRFSGVVDMGGGALVANGTQDALVASFDPTGAFRWARRFGGAGGNTTVDVGHALPLGAVAFSFSFTSAVDLGGGAVTPAGTRESAVVLLDNVDGHTRWVRAAGGTATVTGQGLTVDTNGLVVWTGAFTGAMGPAGMTVTSAGGTDLFVMRLAQ